MTYQVYRNLGADGSWAAGSDQVLSPVGYKIVRLPSGPQGADAAQDIGFGLQGGPFADGLIVDLPALDHPVSFSKMKFFSRSGVSAPVVFRILKNSVQIQTVTINTAGLPTLQKPAIAEIVGAEDDVISVELPSPANAQLVDFTWTFGSTP